MKDAPQEIRTFFVTSVAHAREPLLKKAEMARLFLNVLQDNRKKGRFLLHEFVVMPDHFHLIVTPAEDVPLEKAVQYIKGGFSFRAKKELGFQSLIWQESFANHRIRDPEDYGRHRTYIHHNPVKAGLVRTPSEYPYSSAFPGMGLDPMPPGLKLSRSAGV
jgi:REP-associated tyrosine transposase